VCSSDLVSVNYGIASRYPGLIEINAKLTGELKQKILAHELKHDDTEDYTKNDYNVDFNAKKPHFYESLWFALRNPEALINYLPFMYSYYLEQWTYNSASVYILLIYGILFTCMAWGLFKANMGLCFLAYVNFIIVVQGALLLYVHLYVKYMKFKDFVREIKKN
jgi:hypothetical protein